MLNGIMVSIYCLAYNHEMYIRDALEGFVTQKTNFKYEVFVHDDASTDGTAEIIQQYAEKYPDIIKPILQTENQYTKGIPIIRTYIYPQMSGKYIAICEGDDYWCDIHKLQKQVDFLETHKDYVACVHNTKQINCRTGEENYINSSHDDMDLVFEKVVARGNAQFQLSSLMCKKEFFSVPDEIKGNGFGDYPLAIYLMLCGKVHYFKDVMSVYRLYANGSWTSRHYLSASLEIQIDTQLKLLDFLYRLESYCKKNKIEEENYLAVKKVIRVQEVELLKIQNNYKKIISDYKDVYNELPLKQKIKIKYHGLSRYYKKMRNWCDAKNK